MTSATPSADAVYGVAYGELGYHEGSNNYNKYAAAVGVPNNQAWCTTFASWCYLQAGFSNLILLSDYSVSQYNWFNARGRASGYPAVGAIVWYGPGGENHTGIVYAYDADYIYTIEGNYSDQVATHKRARRSSMGQDDPSIGAVFAYGLPNFAEGVLSADPSATVAGSIYAATASATLPGSTPPPPDDGGGTTAPPPADLYNPYPDGNLPTPGNSSPSAKGLQTLLIHAGYLDAGTALDDNYGPLTQAAVNAFYTAHPDKFVPDTYIGPLGLAQLILDAQAADGYTAPPPAEGDRATYTTVAGDTYQSVASAHSVDLSDLLSWNSVAPAAGATLYVEAEASTPPDDGGGDDTPPDTTDYTLFPGAGSFGTGQSNGYILQLTTWLASRGGTAAPTSTWSSAVQTEMSAFQSAQGYSGSDADGIPGATTWGMLKNHTGNDISSGGGSPTSWVASVSLNTHTGTAFDRYTSGGTVASWIAAACAARGVTDSTAIAHWTTGYQTCISRESSGDANACNRNDSNNVTPAGYSQVHDYGTGYPGGNLNGALTNYQCSRGVAQCIPQTFATYHCPGTTNEIYDPVANIAASMGYVVAVYGVSHDAHDLASKVQQFDPNRSPAGY